MFFTLAGNDSGGPIAVYGASGAVSAWQSIWNNTTDNQYIYMFGDSQETIPGGSGLSYIPNLNYQFFKRFGKSKFMLNTVMGQNNAPTWLCNNRAPGSGTTAFATNELPPGMTTVTRLTGTGSVTMIDHRGVNFPAGSGIPVQEYWNPSQPFYVDVYARCRPSSKEFNWVFTKQSGSSPGFAGTQISSGVSSMGLNDTAGTLKMATFGPFTNNDSAANPYSSFIMYTTGTPGDGNDPDIYAVQIRSAASTGGVNIHSFSVGGYKITDFMTNHANSGPVLASLPAPVALMFHYSTNDIFNSVSAAKVAADYRALITTLRGASWFNNASLPCVLMIDPPRTQVADTAAQIAQHALVYNELVSLAENDGNILVINGKAAVEATTGWYRGSATATDYLSDNVHYTARGGQVLAEKEWSQFIYAGSSAIATAPKFMLPVRFNNPASNKPYITLTNITGLADGKKGTFYMSLKLLAGNGTDLSIMRQNGGTQRFYVYRASNNTIQIVGISSASATVLSLATLSAYTDASGWLNILGSWDLATGFASIYVNETVGNTVTATNTNIAYTEGDDPLTIGQLTSSLVLQNPDMEVGTIFMDYSNSIDITNATNRRKFYTAGGVPVFLGNRGEIPLGAIPHICLYRNAADSLANFANNRGSGGTATLVNSLVDASSTPL